MSKPSGSWKEYLIRERAIERVAMLDISRARKFRRKIFFIAGIFILLGVGYVALSHYSNVVMK